jgi:hypothetical protein
MTKKDGSKARATAICIRPGHLVWMVRVLLKKWLADAYFGSKTRDFNTLLGKVLM